MCTVGTISTRSCKLHASILYCVLWSVLYCVLRPKIKKRDARNDVHSRHDLVHSRDNRAQRGAPCLPVPPLISAVPKRRFSAFVLGLNKKRVGSAPETKTAAPRTRSRDTERCVHDVSSSLAVFLPFFENPDFSRFSPNMRATVLSLLLCSCECACSLCLCLHNHEMHCVCAKRARATFVRVTRDAGRERRIGNRNGRKR